MENVFGQEWNSTVSGDEEVYEKEVVHFREGGGKGSEGDYSEDSNLLLSRHQGVCQNQDETVTATLEVHRSLPGVEPHEKEKAEEKV